MQEGLAMTADNSKEVVYVACSGLGFLDLYLGDEKHKPQWNEKHQVFHTPAGVHHLCNLPPSWARRPGSPIPGQMRDFEDWMFELGVGKMIEQAIKNFKPGG
jgi:hypothetical protein